MLKTHLMAIDAGTGSIRAVLFDLLGNQLACVQKEWEHKEDRRYPGSMDFNWTENWTLVASCIRKVVEKSQISPDSIAAISTTCMREGIILYDKDKQELWACANVDARSSDEAAQLIYDDPKLEKQLYQTTGQSFALDAIPRLLWVKRKQPDIYQKIAYIGMLNDWLIYKLTGILKVEPSNGSTTGLFDLKSRDWDCSVAKQCGLNSQIYPPSVECGTIVGYTTTNRQKETGLPAGIAVVAGGGDAQLGCIGVGVVKPHQAAVFGGSFWQYEYNTDLVKIDPNCQIRVNCHAVPGIWQYEAIAFQPGLVMRWFRDAFCQQEKEIAAEVGCDPYDLMNQEASKIPAGCYGMICTFSDVMNFMNWKHSAPTFTNFELYADKFNRYTFYRSLLENAALITKGHLELVRQTTGHMPDEIVFAGGAAKSPLWCQILSDVLGLPVKIPKVKEATALGAAILAGYGVGLYSDIESTAEQLVVIEHIYTPNEEYYQLYTKLYETWRKVYQAQLDLSDKKITKNMWIAPGL